MHLFLCLVIRKTVFIQQYGWYEMALSLTQIASEVGTSNVFWVVQTAFYKWYALMIYSNSPLNLNLIIPFKDNKDFSKKLYMKELSQFRDDLEGRVVDLKSKLNERFGSALKISIASRSDGGVKRYYWRFTSKLQKRTFNRLCEPQLQAYLNAEFGRSAILSLKEIEEELIYINGNMKIARTIETTLKKFDEEITSLIAFKANNT